MTKHQTRPRTAARLTGALLLVAATASATSCTSTSSAPAPSRGMSGASGPSDTSGLPGTPSPSSATATSDGGPVTGKPGCDDAITVFQNAGTDLAGKVQDLPALQSSVSDLVTRLHAAAAKATDSRVRSAIDKVADDLTTVATDAQGGKGSDVQAALSMLVTDGQAVVEACR